MRLPERRPPTNLIACDECDLLQRPIALPAGGWALCRRCDGPLYRYAPGSLDRALAFSLGAVVLFLIGVTFPIMELELQGNVTSSSLYTAVQQLWNDGLYVFAVLIAATTMLLPALELTVMLSVLLALRMWRTSTWIPKLLRLLTLARPWSMVEIFFMGVLVALVKLAHMADIVIGVALWSLGGMMVLLVATSASFNLRHLWEQVSPQ
ncbi:MAG: paraquat-inducible protein A [Nitrospira sp.]|jgi:paraquat-inducible protein A|nr:paraquat-inducible protein A [Nitrospira sp.]MDH4243392.1 paraquat-inducible protein A [Nitrospira sp.]MDH4355788.1 paraquat-inducible protein A [Nitrospira sp.]MDH5318021.1 paraquat-inducible protein A [Nitrospira sp.]